MPRPQARTFGKQIGLGQGAFPIRLDRRFQLAPGADAGETKICCNDHDTLRNDVSRTKLGDAFHERKWHYLINL